MGNTKEALWEALETGQSGVGPMTIVPPDVLRVSVAAEARQFQGKIEEFGPLPKERKRRSARASR